ncbi:MAG TPA: DedA family protein [Candidatus Stackebrandtia excrementipullorum]|nr:DedA family protein [Candidatus Stackebrandtia excrementipullorum]
MSTTEGGVLSNITDWAVGLMETMGGPGAGLAIALENLFPPLPSEVILPLAGFTASQGKMNLVEALVWTTAGSVVGALLLYYIGVAFGRERIIAIAGKLPLVKVSDIEKTEAWFAKHGVKAVFFGRMIPIFRSLISIPAGVEKMKLPVFLLFTTLGSLIWNTIFVVAGYSLGENWEVVEEYADTYSKVILVGVLLAFAVFVGLRIRTAVKERRNRNDSDDSDAPANPTEPGPVDGGHEHGDHGSARYREVPYTGTGEQPPNHGGGVDGPESHGNGLYRSNQSG